MSGRTKILIKSKRLIERPLSIGMFSLPKDGFIGILTDDEAREMKERISLFKKRFNDDFAKKHQILFGH